MTPDFIKLKPQNGYPYTAGKEEGFIKGNNQNRSGLLSSSEECCINCFVDVAMAFNLPRSLGEIFGLIYASSDPVSFETVKHKLHLSKATTSTGLKLLQKMEVVHAIYVPGDRKSYFVPEEDLNKAFGSLLEESILPNLRRAGEQISKVDISDDNSSLNRRIQNLVSWKINLSIT